ncbi:MAG: NAD(+) synthase [Anaerorhabdus sp.]
MKIAIGQMNVVVGQCENNFNKMLSMIEFAKNNDAKFIVFPEMCISGYCLQDKWNDINFLKTCIAYNERVKQLSNGIGIVFGNVAIDENKNGNDGRCARYNAAYFCKDNEWVTSGSGQPYYIKHLLPNYRLFDEERFFVSALELESDTISPFVVEIDGSKLHIGLEVCEDLWSNDYAFDVTSKYIEQDVDMIFNLSSSPWTLNKEDSRDKQIQYHFNKHGKFVPLVYANACGMQNTGKSITVLDGNSRVYNALGECIGGCNDKFNEECKLIDLDSTQTLIKCEDKLLNALTVAIKEVDKQMFNSNVKWVIGLSGGLDSTINACLLVHALGADRIIGYNMASKYNSDTTKNNAKEMANLLGIEIREGSIEKVVQATVDTMTDYGYTGADQGLTLENIQARVRGHLLSTFASLVGGVVVNNGNKVEVALGYCTMYGDSIGAFSPIGDCTKVQLFEIAHSLNKVFGKEVVPLNLLPQIDGDTVKWDMPPSAELKDSQLDPMKWFYHDWLISKVIEYPNYQIEKVMESYLDGSLLKSDIGRWIRYYGLDDPTRFIDDLEWVLRTIQKAIFKRLQLPPAVVISRGSFGNDFRESQVNFQQTDKYQELRQLILAMKEN